MFVARETFGLRSAVPLLQCFLAVDLGTNCRLSVLFQIDGVLLRGQLDALVVVHVDGA